jgi:hypothetical protein
MSLVMLYRTYAEVRGTDFAAPRLGSAVIVHSALLHGRRAKPGGDPAKPRYFMDVSYCQPGPQRWPNYGRGYETQREINIICMEMGHDRGGRYAHLFDPELPIFYDRDSEDAPPEAQKYVAQQKAQQLKRLQEAEAVGTLTPQMEQRLQLLRATGARKF